MLEGNYLLLDEAPWNHLSQLLDESWFIDCDIDVAMKRVVERHKQAFGKKYTTNDVWNSPLSAGMDDAAAWNRVNTNDRINAEHILQHRVKPNRIIKSITF